jgi:hypothetical protein
MVNISIIPESRIHAADAIGHRGGQRGFCGREGIDEFVDWLLVVGFGRLWTPHIELSGSIFLFLEHLESRLA